jgi:hypothetical protein
MANLAAVMGKVRTWTDQQVEDAVALMPTVKRMEPVGGAKLERLVQAEAQRRAEIRLARGEYGKHDAAWYEPRPLNAQQMLDEMHGRRPRAAR